MLLHHQTEKEDSENDGGIFGPMVRRYPCEVVGQHSEMAGSKDVRVDLGEVDSREEEVCQIHHDLEEGDRCPGGFLTSLPVDLVGKPHTCHLEAGDVYHNDHIDHEEVEAHSHEEDNPEDHHPMGSRQTDHRAEVEVAEAEVLAFCNLRSHDA